MDRRIFFRNAGLLALGLLPALVVRGSSDLRRKLVRYSDNGIDYASSRSHKADRFQGRKLECQGCYFYEQATSQCTFISAPVSAQGACTAWVFK